MNLPLRMEHIKESSQAIDSLLPQLGSQQVGNPSEISGVHVWGHGEVTMNNRQREAQNLSNRTNCSEWLTAEGCQNSPVNILKRTAAWFHFISFHFTSSSITVLPNFT
jgi:hypothetical protein